MRSGYTVAALGAAFVLTAAAAGAGDGILIVQKSTSRSTSVTAIQIEKTRARAEMAGPNGRKVTVVFDGNAQVWRTIDDETKTYTEMTKADADKLGENNSGRVARMQEQAKKMPPEPRARMEAMIREMAADEATAAPVTYKKVGIDKVGKWTCDRYEGTRNGKKVSELCTVAPETFGFAAADFDVTRQMAEFFSKLMPHDAEGMVLIGGNTPHSFAGLPVRSINFFSGVADGVSEITDARRQSFPDAMFAVPADYQKRDLFPRLLRQ